MKEWLQFTTAICTGVLAIAALATLMQFQFAGMRAEMRAGFDTIRMQMRDEHTAMRGEHAAMRDEHTAMRGEHAAMRDEHADIRMEMRGEHAAIRGELRDIRMEMRAEHATMHDQLDSIDRRTARIEGHLFGIEIAPDQQTIQ